MPSRQKREAGKLVPLSPVTANGWISIVKFICGAMVRHFDLDPTRSLEYFANGPCSSPPRTFGRLFIGFAA